MEKFDVPYNREKVDVSPGNLKTVEASYEKHKENEDVFIFRFKSRPKKAFLSTYTESQNIEQNASD